MCEGIQMSCCGSCGGQDKKNEQEKKQVTEQTSAKNQGQSKQKP
jgi:hypothetical protein